MEDEDGIGTACGFIRSGAKTIGWGKSRSFWERGRRRGVVVAVVVGVLVELVVVVVPRLVLILVAVLEVSVVIAVAEGLELGITVSLVVVVADGGGTCIETVGTDEAPTVADVVVAVA